MNIKNKFEDYEGSPSADKWRYLHKKRLPSNFYGLDIDFALIEYSPFPYIVAVLDIKVKGHEKIRASHIVAYNNYCLAPEPYRAPVYIIQINSGFEQMKESEHRMDIHQYIMGSPNGNKGGDKPYTTKLMESQLSWGEYTKWEGKLRDERRNEIIRWEQQHNNEYSPKQMAELQIEETWLNIWKN